MKLLIMCEGANEKKIIDLLSFQNEWNEKRNHREKIYISYDSTSKHCEGFCESIGVPEWPEK